MLNSSFDYIVYHIWPILKTQMIEHWANNLKLIMTLLQTVENGMELKRSFKVVDKMQLKFIVSDARLQAIL